MIEVILRRDDAHAVHLSPTAFSDRIRRLETDLGGQLFERTTRRVALTASGLKLVPQARRCLEEAERCALVISGEISRAQFSTSRSVSSARASGGKVIASRKISSDVAMGKEYLVVVVRGKSSATYLDYVRER